MAGYYPADMTDGDIPDEPRFVDPHECRRCYGPLSDDDVLYGRERCEATAAYCSEECAAKGIDPCDVLRGAIAISEGSK